MVLRCEIKFDQNTNGTFFTGDTVTGKVELHLDRSESVRGIAIKFCGFAKVDWQDAKTAKNSSNKKVENIQYCGREDYMSSVTYVLGSDEGNPIKLHPGIHTYNFAYVLSPTLPTSFEGTHGHIRYLVKVILDGTSKNLGQTYNHCITVLKPVDLNYESPVLRLPYQIVEEKQFSCGFCRSNPLSISLNLPQTGYVPGQIIPIDANVTNSSNITIRNIQFALKKIITYHSQNPSEQKKSEIIYVTKNSAGEVQRKSSRHFTEFILIPSIPPTSTFFCKIIHITYEFEFLVSVSGAHKSLRFNCPITIGTVPLLGVISQQPTLLNQGNVFPVIDPISNSSGQETLPSTDILPPSYEEAAVMKGANVSKEHRHHTDDDEGGSVQFVPRYPVYRFNNNDFSPSAPDPEL